MIPARVVLVLIVGATVAGATPSPVAEHIRAARDAASHILSRSARAGEIRSSSSVTLGNTTYTTYEGCVGGANALIDQLRQQVADGTSRNSTEANAMLASLGTCPIAYAPFVCFALVDRCASVELQIGGDAADEGSSSHPTIAEAQAAVERTCSAPYIDCASYMLSLVGTIAANPTSCSWYHQLGTELERADNCIYSAVTLEGPRLGNSNVSVDYGGTACMGCPAGKAVRITDVFYGLRDSAGSVTCASTSAEGTIEDDCDGKPTCAVRVTDVYMATVPAARTPNGQTCSGNDARLEIQFTCVAPTSMFSDVDVIQAMGDQLEEYVCVRDASGQLCGVWDYERSLDFGNVSYHGGHLSAGQCQTIRDSGSCCWASRMDFDHQLHPSTDPAARQHLQAIYATAISSCAGHNIPIADVMGSWEAQDEHCGTAASIAAGNGGTAAENGVVINTNTVTAGSGSGFLAPSMLLAVVLAAVSM